MNASDDPLSDLLGSLKSRKAKKTEASDGDETANDPLGALLSTTRRRARQRGSDPDVARQPPSPRRRGLSPVALLSLPRNQRDLVNWLARKREAALCDIQNALGQSTGQLTETIRALREAGYIKETRSNGDTYYCVVFSGPTKRPGQGL